MRFIVLISFLSCMTGCMSVDPELPDRAKNIEAVERFVYDIFGAGNLDAIDEVISPEYVGYWAGWGETRGRDELRQGIVEWRTAFPDWSGKIETIVTDGDTVVIRLTSKGTFLGPLGDITPNQRTVEIAEMAILRLVDGLVVEHWEMTDGWSLERQLNIRMPDSGARPAW